MCIRDSDEGGDADFDGVCDDVDDCIGSHDDCGVCNGDGTSCACDDEGGDADFDGVCDDEDDCIGSYDDCGVCNGDGTSCASSCESDVCLTLSDGNVNYNSTADIYGFQFNHDDCASSAGGGDAAANGFTVSASPGVVLAFSFTGSFIPAGEGVLLEGVDCDTISALVFSGFGGAT